MTDRFGSYMPHLDPRLGVNDEYVARVVSRNRVLDIGGRNRFSKSRRKIDRLNKNPGNLVIGTDIIADYSPDLVDDICNTALAQGSFDGIYCVSVLEHVTEYWKAIDNIYGILAPGGEVFLYVPFMYPFHDKMDYHRFTFTEVCRMLAQFSEVKVFMSNKQSGIGWVFWYFVTLSLVDRVPALHKFLAIWFNLTFRLLLWLLHRFTARSSTFDDLAYRWTYLLFNHGFAAWAKK